MAKRVAVEDGLENVKRALRDHGFEITQLTAGTMTGVDAAVVTGLSNNFMGIEDTENTKGNKRNKFPVIDAAGKTADEIVRQIQERVGTV